MSAPEHSPLGKATAYPDRYDPSLLFPIPRAGKRAEIGVEGVLPFHGEDVWNAYELSWLDPRGKPQVAIATFRVPAESPNIIESKSFKLYLNSFAGERLDTDTLRRHLGEDLSAAAGAPVSVEFIGAGRFDMQQMQPLSGECIDDLPIDVGCYGPPRPDFLVPDASGEVVNEVLVSHLLKSNCPVTGQPDWASVQIAYTGPRIDHAGLLRYLVSFREHDEFHEQCVERIFIDIMRHCAPRRLQVYARYTRRGGLDINPFRSSEAGVIPGNPRGARQ